MIDEPLNATNLYRLMQEAADKIGYLSGDSCKVLIALAMLPESRFSLMSLKKATCIDDDIILNQAISDLTSMNLAKFDGKGGIVVNEGLFIRSARL